MSVRVADRHESKVEFIYTARELLKHTIQQTKRKFNNLDRNKTNRLEDLAIDIVVLVNEANSIYISNEQDKFEVVNLYKKARSKLYAMSALLSVFYDTLENRVKDFAWEKWGTLINTELKLLTGIIKKV